MKIAYYVPFAINHDWTPKVVDEQVPAHMLPDWAAVEDLYHEIERDAAKKG